VNTVRQESHRVRSLGLRLATLLLLGGLGWGLFGPFLSLPYLFDDPVVLQAARDARWAEIWTSLRWPVGYYRPLGLTLWKAADLLWREGAVLALRGLGLALHIFNAALVGLLYRRISGSGSRWAVLLAAFGFLLFPFSVQAVIYPSALIHPLVAFFALLGALLASTHTLRGMVGALFPVALAPSRPSTASWRAGWSAWRRCYLVSALWPLIPAFGSLPGSMECSLWPPWRSGFPLLGPERRCEAYRLRIGDGTRFISFRD